MFLRQIEPHPGNINDSGLLDEAATLLRKAGLDLDQLAKRGETTYASDAFETVRALIDEAVSELSVAATRADENAVEDAIGEAADRAYDKDR